MHPKRLFRSLAALAGVLTACLAGCGDTINQSNACDEDTQLSCTCPDTGLDGFIACNDGVLGVCVCDMSDAGADRCTDDIQCDDGAFCNGKELCLPQAEDADERGCVSGMLVPFCDDKLDCTVDTCDDTLNRCVYRAPDEDGDGHGDATCEDGDGVPLGDDCDDNDAERYPGNLEVCDEGNKDEDCDGETFGRKDSDGDGAIDAACCNGDNCGGDCNDKSIAQQPEQPEFCDEVDNDCDGTVDEDAAEVPWYVDRDGDGFGGAGDVVESCIPIPGRSLLQTDCADDRPSRHPAQLELCDFIDNNCDGVADEGSMCGMPQGYPVGDDGGAVGVTDPPVRTDAGMGMGGDVDGDGPVDAGLPDVLLECPSRDTTGAELKTGNVTADETWSGVIELSGNITVRDGATLTIAAGTRILARANSQLRVGISGQLGRLDVLGTGAQPVTLCGTSDLPGYWAGVEFGTTADPASHLSWMLIADASPVDGAGLTVNAPVRLNDVHVRNGTSVGILASDFRAGSARLVSAGNALPARLTGPLAVEKLPPNSVWTGNDLDHIELDFARWDRDTTVPNPGVPYHPTGNISLRGATTIAFEAGSEFAMDPGAHLEVAWNSNDTEIQVNGTADDPVIFRRADANGAWAGFQVLRTTVPTSSLRGLEVRGATGATAAVSVEAPIILEDVLVTGSEGAGLFVGASGLHADSTGIRVEDSSGLGARVHANAAVALGQDISFSGNGDPRIEIIEATHIERSGTLQDFGVPYWIATGETRVKRASGTNPPPTDLVIAPGVEVQWGPGAAFVVGWNGTTVSLTAQGTSADPIVFTASDTQPWAGVRLVRNVEPTSVLDHVEFRGATTALEIENDLPPANLSNCLFSGNQTDILQPAANTNDYTANGNTFE